jgi:hypothetical protein
MNIPLYWAKAVVQQALPPRIGRTKPRTVTLHRYGWSNDSQAAAQSHADTRAKQASFKAAEQPFPADFRHIERQGSYDVEGLPIREEVLERRDGCVLTRNSYGAKCLNTPNVVFVDVDYKGFPFPSKRRFLIATCTWLLITISAYQLFRYGRYYLYNTHGFSFGGALFMAMLGLWLNMFLVAYIKKSSFKPLVIAAIIKLCVHHKHLGLDLALRLYETPAGYRILLTSHVFEPSSAFIADCFATLKADTMYQRLCLQQQCFRARVSPKPWRIGLSKRLSRRTKQWPVLAEHQAERDAWLQAYEAASTNVASCRFVQAFGTTTVHDSVKPILDWHDALCLATQYGAKMG